MRFTLARKLNMWAALILAFSCAGCGGQGSDSSQGNGDFYLKASFTNITSDCTALTQSINHVNPQSQKLGGDLTIDESEWISENDNSTKTIFIHVYSVPHTFEVGDVFPFDEMNVHYKGELHYDETFPRLSSSDRWTAISGEVTITKVETGVSGSPYDSDIRALTVHFKAFMVPDTASGVEGGFTLEGDARVHTFSSSL